MAWTLCSSGAAIFKAGTNVNSNAVDYLNNQTEIDEWSDQSEGSMELETGWKLIDNVSGLGNVSGAIADICSSKVAMKMISYSNKGYLTRESDTLLNVHDDIIKKGMTKLKENTNINPTKPNN
jgi:hypothetical protein